MYEQLNFTQLLAAVIKVIEDGTGLRCYDAVPNDQAYPYYHAEMISHEPVPGKTMLRERYTIYVHAFAEGKNGSVAIFNLINKALEALSVEIELPEDYEVTLQVPSGVQRILDEVDGSKHAVMGYDITVFYGYKMKI